MTEIAEAGSSKEALSSSSYDAIHLLVYGVKQTPSGPKPNTPGLMQLNACMDLLEQGLAGNVVIGGVNYGVSQGDTRISEVYANTLRARMADKGITGVSVFAESEVIPEDKIESGSKDTGGEVEFSLKQARENNWHKIIVIGYEDHVRRAAKLYKAKVVDEVGTDNSFSTPAVTSSTLLQNKHPNFKTRFERSPYRVQEGDSFAKKERRKVLIMDLVDRKGTLISWVAHHTPNDLKLRLNS